MDINRLGTLDVIRDYKQINARMNRSLERLGSGEKAPSPRDDPILWGDVQALKDFSNKLNSFSDNLNRGSASVRVALDTMEASRSQLLQLEERLRTARAAPEGSDDRARALKGYNELHDYIDDIARAPDAGARKILDNPETYSEAGDLVIRAGEEGFNITLRSRQIHAGVDGLNLPKADQATPAGDPQIVADINAATDAELAELIGYIERAKETLVERTKALSVDAVGIEEASGFNSAFITRNDNQANNLNIPDLNAEAILVQANTVKSELAIYGLTGLNDTKKLALQLLR